MVAAADRADLVSFEGQQCPVEGFGVSWCLVQYVFRAVLLALVVLGHIYFHSCIKWPSQPPALLLVPGIFVSASVPWARPALQAKACQVWTLWIFSAPSTCRLHHGDLCGLLSPPHPSHPLSSPSMLWGLCVLVLAPRPVFYVAGLRRTRPGSPACSLCPEACVSFLGSLHPPFVPQGSCGLLSVPPVSHFLVATVRELHNEKAAISVFCLLNPALPGFLRFHRSPLGLPVRSFPVHRNSSCFMTPPGTSSHPDVLHLSFSCSILSYLIPGSLSCPCGALGFSLLPKGGFVAVILHLDEFDVFMGRAGNLPVLLLYHLLFCHLRLGVFYAF